MTRKKIALLSLGAGLILGLALLVFLTLRWNAAWPERDPLGALEAGADDLAELPQPLSLGFLGTVTIDGAESRDCSGVLDLQADEEGLRLCLRDCTLGGDEGATTFSLYADPTQAAALPDPEGGEARWYGVELTRTLAQQAQGTAYGALYSDQERTQAQQAADDLRAALAAVTALGFSPAERETLRAFLEGCDSSAQRADEGWVLHFDQMDGQKVHGLCRDLGLPEGLFADALVADFSLNSDGCLHAVSVGSANLSFELEFGSDPQKELTPRLEAGSYTGEGEAWALTLSLSVDRADEVTAPAYESAFALLGES